MDSPGVVSFHDKQCTPDLSPTKNTIPEPIIFADDTSFIILSKNVDEFCTTAILLLPHVNECTVSSLMFQPMHFTTL
jgi:hypothetical protein